MRLTKEAGFKRIYIVAQQDTASSWQIGSPDFPVPGKKHYYLESLLNLGDPWFQFITAAKRHGLEVYIRFKPYESGGVYSVPENRKTFLPYNTIEQLGGPGYGYPDFIYRHPEMRVKRLNYRKNTASITAVEFAWIAEEVPCRGDGGIIKTIGGSIEQTSVEHPQLYYSNDNRHYHMLDIPYREFIEKRMITKADGTGDALFDTPKRCRVIRFENLSLPDNASYLALRYGNNPNLKTIAFTMTKLYSGETELEYTASTIPRHRPMLLDDMSWTAYDGFDFRKDGFEFESIENIFWGEGWSSPIEGIGVARGKMEYMKGILCEGYPEVREYWLGRIRDFVNMGADGVNIRFRCHSGSVVDFASYGGNEPLLKRYRERCGTDCPIEAEKMMRVRGSYFMEFYEAAAEKLHADGKRIECDLQGDFCNPHLDFDFNHSGFWTLPKILPDWEKMIELSDHVTLDDFNFGRYSPEYASKIKDFAAQKGKSLHVHCYLQQGMDLNPEFLAGVQADSRITGIDIYEMVCVTNPDRPPEDRRGYFEVTPDGRIIINETIAERIFPLLNEAVAPGETCNIYLNSKGKEKKK